MIFLIGASGSGKSTLAKRLVEKGYKEVVSYTTRPKRYEGEEGHIFVDKYDGNGIAYSKFNGYEYWCTQEQLDTCDVYVVDWNGIDMLRDRIGEQDVVVYIDVSEEERVRRMKLRGDSDEMIKSRIENDRKMFPSVSHVHRPANKVHREERKYEADIIFEDMSVEDMVEVIINELQDKTN